MKETKYKAFIKSKKEIRKVMSLEFENGKLTRLIVEPSKNDSFCRDKDGTVLVGIEKDPKDVELLQYTGLHDNTKWEQLTQEEKEEFYYQNYSEDGKTIKYPNVEYMKNLWKGKEIYEGDIIKYDSPKPLGIIWYDEMAISYRVYWGVEYATNCVTDLASTFIIVGNVTTNPELLKE